MSNIENFNTNFFDSYIDENRIKIDESLVSLRFMKEVDDFIEFNKISQRRLAEEIGYTEAYISQLMSGVKKVNTSFINKFEKRYEIKVQFKFIPKANCDYITGIANSFISLNINLNLSQSIETCQFFNIESKPSDSYLIDADSFIIENHG